MNRLLFRFLFVGFLFLSSVGLCAQSTKSLKDCIDYYKKYQATADIRLFGYPIGVVDIETLPLFRTPEEEIEAVLNSESSFYKEYRDDILSCYSLLHANFFVDKYVDVPAFFPKNESDIGIFLGAFWYDSVFNTLRTDEKERSIKVVRELLMPIVYETYKNLKNTPIRSVLVMGVYPAMSFMEKNRAPKAEIVACLCDMEDVAKVLDDYEQTE